MPNVFISYHHGDPDRAFAEQLAACLRKQSITVFMDTLIPPGVRWGYEIERLLSESQVLLVLVSAEATQSEFILKELSLASALEKQGKLRIIPVRLNYDRSLPFAMAILDQVQQISWTPDQPFEAVCGRVVEIIIGADQLEQELLSAGDNYRAARHAFRKKSNLTGWQARARGHFARFWEKRALRTAAADPEQSLLAWLQAAAVESTETRLREAAELMGADGSYLVTTFRALPQNNNPILALLSLNPKKIVSFFGDIARKLMPFYPNGAVSFSPDGSLVLSCWASSDVAYLWKTATGAFAAPPLKHDGPVLAAAFSPDGRYIVTGSWDNYARIWRADTAELLAPPLAHKHAVIAVAFSPDSEVIATASGNDAYLWSVSTRELLCPALNHNGMVLSVAFDAQGRKLLTRSWDRVPVNLHLWNVDDGTELDPDVQRPVPGARAAFRSDAAMLVTGSQDGSGRVWDVRTAQPVTSGLEHYGAVTAVALSSDGKSVLTGGSDKVARIWDAGSGEPAGPPLHHQATVSAVAFSPDGQFVLTQSQDSSVRLWTREQGPARLTPLRHQGRITTISLGAAGDLLIAGSKDGTAQVWNWKSGSAIAGPLTHDLPLDLVALSPDNQSALTLTNDGALRFWKLPASDTPFQRLGEGQVRFAAFSTCGKMIFAAGKDGTVRAWSAESGEPLGSLSGHTSAVAAVVSNSDSSVALTGSEDRTARLWSLSNWQQVEPQFLHGTAVTAVAITGDGRIAATGAVDGGVRLWETASGRQLGDARVSESVAALAFSAGEKALLVATATRVDFFAFDGERIDLYRRRRLPGWLLGPGGLRLDTPDGSRLTAALADDRNVFVEAVDRDMPSSIPIAGDAQAAFEIWQQRLGLHLEEASGEFLPSFR